MYMPELELIVELKIKSSAWTTARVERQIAEQQATKTDWLVIGSAPNGEYGLFDMDDTIGIINGLQLQALQQGLAT